MIDRDTLLLWLATFTERFNVPAMSQPVIRGYARALGHLETDQFVVACEHLFTVNRFFPTPQEILDAACPEDAPDLVAAEILDDVMRWRGKNELHKHVLSAATARAMSAIGGHSRLAQATETDMPWLRKEFVAAYVSADRVQKSRDRVERGLLAARKASPQLTSGPK